MGKSNILGAIKYFYNNIDQNSIDTNIFDSINTYNKNCRISITFDLIEFEVKINNRYFKDLFNKFNEAFINDRYYNPLNNKVKIKKITLNMIQDKNNNIHWNHNLEVRKKLKSLFPLYYIDTRSLDLSTWDKLWDIISDLTISAVSKDQDEIIQILDDAFGKIYSSKYNDSKAIISEVFDSNSITLDKFHFTSRYKSTFMMRFGGEAFTHEGRSLDYYSDGMNSFMYLKLLLTLIPKISDISCKSPTILLDEPEIGLHQERISELIQAISQNINKNTLVLTNTHSPKVVEDLVQQKCNFDIYRVSLSLLHTVCNKLNKNWLNESNHIISILETSCYFADNLVFVEGESELQLFHNTYIKELFPFLKNIYFYSFNSNNQRLKLVNPSKLNLGIPYLLIVDMDKIITYNKKNGYYMGTINNDSQINPLNKTTKNTEKYSYFSNISNYISIKEKIYKQLNQSKFNYEKSKHYINNSEYENLLSNIRNYCSKYNVFVNRATIESSIISTQNIDKFIAFARSNKKIPKVLLNINDKSELTALTRAMCHGRLELSKEEPKEYIFNEKTNWINDWINFYFTNFINTLSNKEDKLKTFYYDFPDLHYTLQYIKLMI